MGEATGGKGPELDRELVGRERAEAGWARVLRRAAAGEVSGIEPGRGAPARTSD